MQRSSLAVSLLVFSLVQLGGLACSYVEVAVPDLDPQSKSGNKYVIGRTLELAYDAVPTIEIRVHPRGEEGARFGYVGIEGHRLSPGKEAPDSENRFVGGEGMNEAGFTVSQHTFRMSEYEALEMSQEGDVESFFVAQSLLQNSSSVEEALAWLAEHRIVGTGGEYGFHWALADATGRSAVVEYLKGQRTVHENTARVLTNDPSLEWHLQNLNTYANLSPEYPHGNDFLGVKTSVGVVPRAVGHGWNLFGLPGDSSSPSRFAQLFYLRGYAMRSAPPQTTDDGIVLASGLLNKVFILRGTVAADSQNADDHQEITNWAVIKIPTAKRMLMRSYRDLQWRQVDLNRIDFTRTMRWPIEAGTLGIKDITEVAEGLSESVV